MSLCVCVCLCSLDPTVFLASFPRSPAGGSRLHTTVQDVGNELERERESCSDYAVKKNILFFSLLFCCYCDVWFTNVFRTCRLPSVCHNDSQPKAIPVAVLTLLHSSCSTFMVFLYLIKISDKPSSSIMKCALWSNVSTDSSAI